MKYGSVCSGIEAATVAWHPLGWKPCFFSEIDKFPRQLLSHHYPEIPLHGDFTTIEAGQYAAIDVLVGGTPCQSFSIAGLRAGLDDPRGNLMLEFGALAKRLRPRWLVWENVPGVLSSNGGRDFGAFLGMLGELGYGFAYRVLDAQYFGVAQRRRRVFVVGYVGNWRCAAAVLFESESLRGNSAPSSKKRKISSSCALPSVAGSLDTQCGSGKLTHQSISNGHLIGTITARMFNALGARDVEEGAIVPVDGTGKGITSVPISFGAQMSNPQTDENLTQTLQAKNPMAVAFDTYNQTVSTEIVPTLCIQGDTQGGNASVLQLRIDENSVAVSAEHYTHDYCQDRVYSIDGISPALNTAQRHNIRTAMQVRRLTPRECERLQGFPDDYTDIKPSGKNTPDGPRYKALGNSMAVPVMHWIGKRIQMVESI